MPITVGNIVDALEALGGEAHYSDITAQILKVAHGPFPADPTASVRARLQERCSDYKAYKHKQDLFESDAGTGIWRFRQWQKATPQPSTLKEEVDSYEGFEGRLVPKVHLVRERDPKLVAKFKASLAEARCEACSINLSEIYGALAADYIEAHHKNPVALIQEGSATTLDDLAALCPNCHRIIHKNYPMSVDELAAVISGPDGFIGDIQSARQNRKSWRDAVHAAIVRLVNSEHASNFTRQNLIEHELAKIIADVDSKGETPEQTLSRVLQELKSAGVIDFVDNRGTYRLK